MKSRRLLRSGMERAREALRAADSILIASHRNPDGDTIGCLLALGLALLQWDKRVIMVSPDGIPPRFQFLPGSDLVVNDWRGKADVAVAVDCGSAKQMGPFLRTFQMARKTIQIDHHDFGEGFGHIMVVDNEAAAVGEILYEFLKGLRVDITPAIATCLLTSIIVDTGSFRFSNVRSRTLRICADLLDCGVDMKHLIEESYWKKSRAMIRLEAFCALRMNFELNGQVVWTIVHQRDVKREGAVSADVDGVADVLRSIEGVKVAALMRESPGGVYRVSLRSGMGINVARVAQSYGGGGHHQAAGCTIKATRAAREKLVRELCEVAAQAV